MTEQKRTDSSPPYPSATKLYAIFHGEIMFFDDGQPNNEILGLAPAMDIHVYSAGPWLAEKRIPPGLTLELQGVNSGKFSFDNNPDLTVMFGGGDPRKNTKEKPYLTLRLPRPDNIISGGRISLEGVSIEPAPGQSVSNNGSIAHALIFEYTPSGGPNVPRLVIQDGGKQLEKMNQPMLWQAADVGNGTFNLHVFAEADVIPSPQHIREASQMGLALAGISATFTVKQEEIGNLFIDVPAPKGLLAEEVNFNLADRASMLGLLTKALHQGNLQKGVTVTSASLDPAVYRNAIGQSGCGSCVVSPKPRP
jgi:hypothetical protein